MSGKERLKYLPFMKDDIRRKQRSYSTDGEYDKPDRGTTGTYGRDVSGDGAEGRTTQIVSGAESKIGELNNELQEQFHILPSIEEILELLEKKDGEIQTLKEKKQMLNDENQQWKELAEKLKAKNQMLWVRKMNNIMTCAEEIVVRELVYV